MVSLFLRLNAIASVLFDSDNSPRRGDIVTTKVAFASQYTDNDVAVFAVVVCCWGLRKNAREHFWVVTHHPIVTDFIMFIDIYIKISSGFVKI